MMRSRLLESKIQDIEGNNLKDVMLNCIISPHL